MNRPDPVPPGGSEAVTSDPNAAFAQALALEGERRFADAEAAYRELLRAHPGNGAILHNLALNLRAQGRLADAEGMARQAVQAEAAKPAYHNTLGVILRALGRWD